MIFLSAKFSWVASVWRWQFTNVATTTCIFFSPPRMAWRLWDILNTKMCFSASSMPRTEGVWISYATGPVCDLHHDFWILEYVIAMMGLTEIVRTRSGSFLKGGSSRRSFGGRRCSNDNLDHMAAAASGSNNLRGDKSLSSGHVTPTRRNSSLSSTRSNQLLKNPTHMETFTETESNI